MEKNYAILKYNKLKDRKLSIVRLLLVGIILLSGNFLTAQNQGPLYPGTQSTQGGASNWTNPNRIASDNNLYATNGLNGNEVSRYITGSNYGFTIPGTAIIVGIEVSIERFSNSNAGGNSIEDNNLRLLKANTLIGTNHANLGADWPDTNGVANYGSPTDLWGTTWTPAEINAAGFGVGFAVQAENSSRTAAVDYIRIRVYYTNGPTITSFAQTSACAGQTPTITINGTGFASPASVSFNGTASPTVVVVSSTQITATLPAAATTGLISVTVPSGTTTSASALPGNFTVNPVPAVAPITGTHFVCPGATTPLANATPGGVWSSSNTLIATVNGSGVVSGVASGNAVITYTVTSGGCSNSATANVTVYSNPVISGPSTVCVGNTILLTSGPAGSWSSNNNPVATIDNSGVVTGVTSGSAIITFLDATTGCSQAKTITVEVPPAISTQPTASQSACSGTSVSFSVTATGAGLTYQWYKMGSALSNGGNLSGATSNTLTLNPVSVADASASYYCIVTGNCAPPIQSNDAALTVTEAVSITAQPAPSQSYCTGNSASISVTATGDGLTYQWFNGINPMVDGGNISGVTTPTLSINPLVVGDASANYYVVVTGISPCSPVTSSNSELIVNETPVITSPPVPTQTVCDGDPVSLSIFAVGGSLTYQWYKGATPVVDGGNISGAATNTLNFTPISVVNAASDYHCVIGNGCAAAVDSGNAEIIVNLKPVIPAQSTTTCSETAFTVNPVDGIPAGTIVPANTTYTWTTPIVTGGMTGGTAQPVAQPVISEVFINPTNVAQTATYTVTPTSGTAGACLGNPFTVVVTVDPLPYIVNLTPTVCSGEALTITPVHGGGNIIPAGTTYSWPAPTVSGGITGGTAGTAQSAITQTLFNPTNTPQTATYNVTATSGSCTGSTFTISITVNPKPNVSGALATQAVCSGTAIASILITNPNNVPGATTFNWTRDNLVNLTGMPASDVGNTISGTLVNTTGTPQTATFTLYATSEEGCISLPSTVTVLVNPIPVPLATPAAQTVCSGIAITTVNLSTSNGVAGTSYSWTRTNTIDLTGIAASGIGPSISGILTNNTAVQQTTIFTVTGLANGCSTTATFTVIVNPQPDVVAAPATQTLCGSLPFSTINITNPNAIPGTTYTWTRNNIANLTGVANSGNGAAISGTLVNNTNVDQTTIFTITASAAGCASTTTTAAVTVSATPTVSALPGTQAHCNGINASITLSNPNNIAGTVITWTRDNTTNITGIANSGSGSISGILTNNTTTTQVTVFTITAAAPNGCSRTMTASVTVYATLTTPTIGNSQTVCVLSTPGILSMTTPVAGGSGVYTYQWQSSADNITFANIGGATGAIYQPPFVGGGTDNTFYRLIVTNACGSVTSNSVFVEVVSNVGFSFNVDDGIAGANNICSGASFTPDISSIHLSTSAVRFAWTADPAYITPATGGPVGTTSGAFLFIRTSSANIGPLTAQNNSNASVTTSVTVTPSVYNYPGPPSGSFICSVTPQVFNITIRPTPVATITSPLPLPTPPTAICSGTSPGVTVTGNVTDAVMTYAWTRNNTANVTSPTNSGNSGNIAVGGSFTIPFVLTNATGVAQNVTYTITPSSNGCAGTPVQVTVIVNPPLTPGVVAASQTICNGGNPAAFTQTTPATGSNLSYQWQSSMTSATGPWTDISGATATTYDDPGPITQTTWYIRVVTSTVNGLPCAIQNTTPIQVSVNIVTPGTVSGDQTICSGGNPAAFTSTAATGTGAITYQWESSTVGCSGPWANIGGNVQNLDVPAGVLVTTYYRRRATAATGTCSEYSNCIVVSVNNVTGGTVGSDQTLCGNNPAAFTVITVATGPGGPGSLTYQWQSNTTGCGGTFTNIPGATAATYDAPPGLTQTTYYKRVTTSLYNSTTCTADSNCITVTANTVTGGVISGNRTVCNGGDPTAFTVTTPSTGTNITYQWQSSTTGGVGTWVDIPGATAATYDVPGPATQIMYYQRVTFSEINSVSCSAVSNFVTVFVNDAVPPVMDGNQTVCADNPAAFTIITPASGNGSTLTYLWQSSTGNCSGPWSTASGISNGATYDPPVLAQTTYYRVLFTSTLNGQPCTVVSNCIIVTVNSKTWNGSVNTDWNVAANWTPSGVPTSANCVVIPNTPLKPVISGGGYIGYGLNLSILNGGRLDVNSANSVFITNFVNVSPTGIFNIADNASLVQTDNVANTGIVNMIRITPPVYRFDYTYWNSPMVMGTYTLGNLSPNTQPDKYYSWNPTNGGAGGNWIQESVATIMNPTKGYIIRAPNTFSFTPDVTMPYTATFTGTPNNGNINIPIAIGTLGAGTSNDKMNLIGNPYPSAVSANAFLNHPANAALLDGTIYFWTHHAPPSAAFANPFYGTFALNYSPNGYATYNALGSTNTVPSGFGGTPPNGFIGAGQSFFAKGLGNGNALFDNTMRVTGNNNVFFRTTNHFTSAAPEFESHRIWLNLADTQGTFSQILVGYTDTATNDLDRKFDGESLSTGTSLYSVISGKSLTIQGRALPFEESDTVPLGYVSTVVRSFTIGIDHLDGLFENQNVYLEDKLLNVIHDIKESPYSFNTEIGTFNDRFILRYTNASLGTGNPYTPAGLVMFIKNKTLFVDASEYITSINIYDVAGKLIKVYTPASANRHFESEFTFAQGVYLAKVKLESGLIVTSKLANGN